MSPVVSLKWSLYLKFLLGDVAISIFNLCSCIVNHSFYSKSLVCLLFWLYSSNWWLLAVYFCFCYLIMLSWSSLYVELPFWAWAICLLVICGFLAFKLMEALGLRDTVSLTSDYFSLSLALNLLAWVFIVVDVLDELKLVIYWEIGVCLRLELTFLAFKVLRFSLSELVLVIYSQREF